MKLLIGTNILIILFLFFNHIYNLFNYLNETHKVSNNTEKQNAQTKKVL